MSSVVITGAGGFLGRRLVPRLAGTVEVVAVARESVPGLSRVTPIAADLGPGWTVALPSHADGVVWLAQSRRYREFPDGAHDMFRVNEAALFDLLDWARRSGVQRLVYASTGSVYAASSAPLAETAPTLPSSFYAASKLNGEHLVSQYAGEFEVVIARIFGLYGSGQTGMAMAAIVEAVAQCRPVELTDGVGMTLTPLHVDDAAAIMEQLLRVELPEPLLVVNVAGVERVTLADVARETGRLLGIAPVIRSRSGEAPALIADVAKLRALLPGMMFKPLRAGLAETLRVS